MSTFTDEEALILSGLFKTAKEVTGENHIFRPYIIRIGKVKGCIFSNGDFKIKIEV